MNNEQEKKYVEISPEILDNPNIALLDDRTWRRLIEMFLISRKTNDDGCIPDIETLAWHLRISENTMANDIRNLIESGMISEYDDEGYFINSYHDFFLIKSNSNQNKK